MREWWSKWETFATDASFEQVVGAPPQPVKPRWSDKHWKPAEVSDPRRLGRVVYNSIVLLSGYTESGEN